MSVSRPPVSHPPAAPGGVSSDERPLPFHLQRTASGSQARAGALHTRRGVVLTPVFMPVGTQATVRTQTFETLEAVGSRILLANTWHLMRRPGAQLFEAIGGIHRLTGWQGAFLTDSGGFQIFSLSHQLEMTEKGARFRPHKDQASVLLTPESAMHMQQAIGSDIRMVLDHCVPSTVSHEAAEDAMHRTHRWAERSLEAHLKLSQEPRRAAIFGIVQGACHADLRALSAETLTKLPFDGFAIGGLAVGETRAEREHFTAFTTPFLPVDKPRYLMGVGMPIDLLEAVHRGVDMFDCILPTAQAGRGVGWTFDGELKLRREVFALDEQPLEADCPCPTCRTTSRAFLHHLIKAEEVLGWQLLATHNIAFCHRLMKVMRDAILEDRFVPLYESLRHRLTREQTPPPPPRAKKRPAGRLGAFQLHQRADGGYSVQHQDSGEVMHAVLDPREEARVLYLEQSQLLSRLEEPLDEPLVAWDVGLGAATNAMVLIDALERLAHKRGLEAPPLRPLHLVSFERDMDALRLALMHLDRFPWLKHPGPPTLLKEGYWQSRKAPIQWTLLEGDFLARMSEAPSPELILYDPFSFKVDGPLWQLSSFEQLFARVRGRACELITYSHSTMVRSALLGAGFYLAAGVPVGVKEQTTIALTPEAASRTSHALLDRVWLAKWERSSKQFPADVTEEAQAAFAERIRGHVQFGHVQFGHLQR